MEEELNGSEKIVPEDEGTVDACGSAGMDEAEDGAEGAEGAGILPMGDEPGNDDRGPDDGTGDGTDAPDEADAAVDAGEGCDAGDGAQGDPKVDEPECPKKPKRRMSRGRIAATVAAAACAVSMLGFGAYAGVRTANAANAEDAVVERYRTESANLEQSVSDAESAISAGADAASDPKTYDAVVAACDAYGSAGEMSRTEIGWEKGDVSPFDYTTAEDSLNAKQEQLRDITEHGDIIREATDAYKKSVHDKQVSDARDALQKASDDAVAAADGLADQVMDKATVDKVRNVAQQSVSQMGDKDDLDWFASQQDAIEQASADVSASHDAWQKEQERLKEEYGWRPTIQVYEGMNIPYGGSTLYRWRSGYYLAHSTTAAGRMIASHPKRVTIGGKTYQYVSTKNVPYGAEADPALAYARQNGGIGFQTCNGDGATMQINHYEPVSVD